MKQYQRASLAVAGLVSLMWASWAHADEVILNDGSRLVGTISSIGNGKVVIVTDFAGKLEFEFAKVKAIATEAPVNIALDTGDRLVGPVRAAPDGSQSSVQSAIGEVTLNTGDVTHLWREGGESPEALAAKAEVDKYKPKWLYRVELGASATEGNTDTALVLGRVGIDRKTDIDLLQFYAKADYAEQDDARTRNEYIGGVYYEHEFLPRYYWYGRGELEHDEFENLDLRATVALGVGHYWIKKPEHGLKTRIGGGYRHESFDSDRTEDDAILDLGLDYRKDVTKWMQFAHSATYTPSLERFSDYRLDFDTGLLFPLKFDQWKIKLGMQNKYNSNPDDDLERLDNLYYASVLLEIKK